MADSATDEPGGTATVTTVPLHAESVSQIITAYGSVTAQPGAVVVLSVAVESRVRRLHVAGGQVVDRGQVLIEVEPSPDARLQWIEARNGLEGAENDASNARQRFELKLATNADVETADRAVRTARTKLSDMETRGAGEESRTVSADASGVVAKVDVQEGQLVPAGAPLVEIVPRGQIEVRFGVEPSDSSLVRAEQTVELFPATSGDDDEPVDGKIRLVTGRVNPDSRLVDVFVTPPETDRMVLDSFVRGELTVRTVSGLVVPHDALLLSDDGFIVFTIVNGHAAKHAVKVALQNDKEAVVTGEGLHDGDSLVVTGALELDEGTAVTVSAPASAPSAAEEDK